MSRNNFKSVKFVRIFTSSIISVECEGISGLVSLLDLRAKDNQFLVKNEPFSSLAELPPVLLKSYNYYLHGVCFPCSTRGLLFLQGRRTQIAASLVLMCHPWHFGTLQAYSSVLTASLQTVQAVTSGECRLVIVLVSQFDIPVVTADARSGKYCHRTKGIETHVHHLHQIWVLYGHTAQYMVTSAEPKWIIPFSGPRRLVLPFVCSSSMTFFASIFCISTCSGAFHTAFLPAVYQSVYGLELIWFCASRRRLIQDGRYTLNAVQTKCLQTAPGIIWTVHQISFFLQNYAFQVFVIDFDYHEEVQWCFKVFFSLASIHKLAYPLVHLLSPATLAHLLSDAPMECCDRTWRLGSDNSYCIVMK